MWFGCANTIVASRKLDRCLISAYMAGVSEVCHLSCFSGYWASSSGRGCRRHLSSADEAEPHSYLIQRCMRAGLQAVRPGSPGPVPAGPRRSESRVGACTKLASATPSLVSTTPTYCVPCLTGWSCGLVNSCNVKQHALAADQLAWK